MKRVALLLFLTGLISSGSVSAQMADRLPGELEGVGVEQKLDAQIPLDLTFTDERGRQVRLGDYFEEGRPVLLNLAYYRCPMLCNLVLDGMLEALSEIDWLPGREFEIVTVSIDPTETPHLAAAKKQNYLREYGRSGAERGWHFLTGRPEAIKELADAVGFGYQYVRERKEYAHPAVLFVSTPEGRLSRYLFGIRYDPRTVRLSLVEAADGKVGSVVDQFLLYCYQYDSEEGQYTPLAWRIMRLGSGLVLAVLGAMLVTYWMRETRQKRIA